MGSSPRGEFGRSALHTVTVYAGTTSAVLAIVALVGFITVVGSKTISEAAVSSAFFLPAAAALGSTVAAGIALVGLFVWQMEQLRTLGVAGFVVAFIGTMMATGAQWSYLFIVPHFAEAVPAMIDESTGTVLAGFFLSYAVLSLGWIVFGVATLRAGRLPRKGVIAMIVGAALAFVPMPSRTLVLSLSVAYLAAHMGERAASGDGSEDEA